MNESKFKIGDRVKITSCQTAHVMKYIGTEAVIYQRGDSNIDPFWRVRMCDGYEVDIYEIGLDLITNKKNNMTLKEKFVLAFLGEPEKSFRKTDITNGDGFLTTEGQAVFLAWLLKENGTKFKTDVVDGMLADLEKECGGCK